jgi:hypothetical protein
MYIASLSAYPKPANQSGTSTLHGFVIILAGMMNEYDVFVYIKKYYY